MIRRIFALAGFGFLQLIRSRVYLNILVAGAMLVVAALAFDELSGSEGGRVLLDIGLAFVALTVALLAGVIATTTVTREIEAKQVHLVVARPLHRFEYVLGRYATVVMLVVVSNVFFGLLLAALLKTIGYPDWSLGLSGCLFASFEAFIVAAIALFFGVSSSSTMSTLFTSTIFIAGRLTGELSRLIDKGTFGEAAEPALRAARFLLPQLPRFDLTRLGHGNEMFGAVVAEAAAYGCLYAAGFVLLAAWRFSRRDLL